MDEHTKKLINIMEHMVIQIKAAGTVICEKDSLLQLVREKAKKIEYDMGIQLDDLFEKLDKERQKNRRKKK